MNNNNKEFMDNSWFVVPMFASFVLIYGVRVMLEEGGFFGSVFLSIVIGFVVSFLHNLATAPARKAELARQRNIEFYEKCIQNGINSLDTEKNFLRAELIAKDIGCGDVGDLRKYFEKGQKLSSEASAEKMRTENAQHIAKLLEEEKAEHSQLSRYAECTGNEKTIRILSEQLEELKKSYQSMKDFGKNASSLLIEKERDWAVAGGIASGIAGGAAGIATAIDAQMENAEIRARNAQNYELIAKAQAGMYTSGAISKAKDSISAKEKELSAQKIKLVAKMSGEELLSYLNISNDRVSVSETGAFRVSADVSMPEPLIIYDDLPARIDGTLVAQIFQDGAQIGEAELVMPLYGVCHGKELKMLKGIGLSGASADKPCTVSFSGKKLYAIEN